MDVVVIGAAGGVGRRLCSRLSARGDGVTGLFRDPAQAEAVAASGARPVLADLIADSVDDLAARLAGAAAAVFTAGAHGTGADRTTAIDGDGLVKSAQAAAQAGVRRFVLVSVFPDAGRGTAPSEGFEHYMRVKKAADGYLSRTDLDWLIVRPGTLTDDPGDGRVTAGPAIDYGTIPRDDVAVFIAATLHTPALTRSIVELTAGRTPIDDAIAELVALRADESPR